MDVTYFAYFAYLIPIYYFRVICCELDIQSNGFGMTLNFDPAD